MIKSFTTGRPAWIPTDSICEQAREQLLGITKERKFVCGRADESCFAEFSKITNLLCITIASNIGNPWSGIINTIPSPRTVSCEFQPTLPRMSSLNDFYRCCTFTQKNIQEFQP
jgi:hypothetical protein